MRNLHRMTVMMEREDDDVKASTKDETIDAIYTGLKEGECTRTAESPSIQIGSSGIDEKHLWLLV